MGPFLLVCQIGECKATFGAPVLLLLDQTCDLLPTHLELARPSSHTLLCPETSSWGTVCALRPWPSWGFDERPGCVPDRLLCWGSDSRLWCCFGEHLPKAPSSVRAPAVVSSQAPGYLPAHAWVRGQEPWVCNQLMQIVPISTTLSYLGFPPSPQTPPSDSRAHREGACGWHWGRPAARLETFRVRALRVCPCIESRQASACSGLCQVP